jgi:hypothetical protein
MAIFLLPLPANHKGMYGFQITHASPFRLPSALSETPLGDVLGCFLVLKCNDVMVEFNV